MKEKRLRQHKLQLGSGRDDGLLLVISLCWLLPSSVRTSSLQKEYERLFAFSRREVYTVDVCKTS